MLGEELLVEVAELEVVKIDDVAIVHHAVHRGHECPRIGLGEVPLLHPKHGRMVLQEAKRGRELLGVLGGVVAIGVGALELEDRRERAPVEQRQRPRIEVRDVDRPKQEIGPQRLSERLPVGVGQRQRPPTRPGRRQHDLAVSADRHRLGFDGDRVARSLEFDRQPSRVRAARVLGDDDIRRPAQRQMRQDRPW